MAKSIIVAVLLAGSLAASYAEALAETHSAKITVAGFLDYYPFYSSDFHWTCDNAMTLADCKSYCTTVGADYHVGTVATSAVLNHIACSTTGKQHWTAGEKKTGGNYWGWASGSRQEDQYFAKDSVSTPYAVAQFRHAPWVTTPPTASHTNVLVQDFKFITVDDSSANTLAQCFCERSKCNVNADCTNSTTTSTDTALYAPNCDCTCKGRGEFGEFSIGGDKCEYFSMAFSSSDTGYGQDYVAQYRVMSYAHYTKAEATTACAGLGDGEWFVATAPTPLAVQAIAAAAFPYPAYVAIEETSTAGTFSWSSGTFLGDKGSFTGDSATGCTLSSGEHIGRPVPCPNATHWPPTALWPTSATEGFVVKRTAEVHRGETFEFSRTLPSTLAVLVCERLCKPGLSGPACQPTSTRSDPQTESLSQKITESASLIATPSELDSITLTASNTVDHGAASDSKTLYLTESASASLSLTDSPTITLSDSVSASLTESASDSETLSLSPSVTESSSESVSSSTSASSSESVSSSESQSTSESSSLSTSDSVSVSESQSTSSSDSLSTSATASTSESASATASESASVSASASASESSSVSDSASASASATTSSSESVSVSDSSSVSASTSQTDSESVSTSASQSESSSVSSSTSVSVSESASESTSLSLTISVSETATSHNAQIPVIGEVDNYISDFHWTCDGSRSRVFKRTECEFYCKQLDFGEGYHLASIPTSQVADAIKCTTNSRHWTSGVKEISDFVHNTDNIWDWSAGRHTGERFADFYTTVSFGASKFSYAPWKSLNDLAFADDKTHVFISNGKLIPTDDSGADKTAQCLCERSKCKLSVDCVASTALSANTSAWSPNCNCGCKGRGAYGEHTISGDRCQFFSLSFSASDTGLGQDYISQYQVLSKSHFRRAEARDACQALGSEWNLATAPTPLAAKAIAAAAYPYPAYIALEESVSGYRWTEGPLKGSTFTGNSVDGCTLTNGARSGQAVPCPDGGLWPPSSFGQWFLVWRPEGATQVFREDYSTHSIPVCERRCVAGLTGPKCQQTQTQSKTITHSISQLISETATLQLTPSESASASVSDSTSVSDSSSASATDSASVSESQSTSSSDSLSTSASASTSESASATASESASVSASASTSESSSVSDSASASVSSSATESASHTTSVSLSLTGTASQSGTGTLSVSFSDTVYDRLHPFMASAPLASLMVPSAIGVFATIVMTMMV